MNGQGEVGNEFRPSNEEEQIYYTVELDGSAMRTAYRVFFDLQGCMASQARKRRNERFGGC